MTALKLRNVWRRNSKGKKRDRFFVNIVGYAFIQSVLKTGESVGTRKLNAGRKEVGKEAFLYCQR